MKYYKEEDVIRAIEEMQNCYNGYSDTYDKAEIIGVLEELPTIDIVYCSECICCEQDLLVERTIDGYERFINFCHVSKPPKLVELHHYCGYGKRGVE